MTQEAQTETTKELPAPVIGTTPNTIVINSIDQHDGIPCARWEAWADRMNFPDFEACKDHLKTEWGAKIVFEDNRVLLRFEEQDSYMRWLIVN